MICAAPVDGGRTIFRVRRDRANESRLARSLDPVEPPELPAGAQRILPSRMRPCLAGGGGVKGERSRNHLLPVPRTLLHARCVADQTDRREAVRGIPLVLFVCRTERAKQSRPYFC